MNKKKRYLFISIVAMMLFLTGCGESLYELTAEEEALVIHSAAYYVAKHNIQQKDGVNGIAIPEESASEAETEVVEMETEVSNSGNASGGEQDKQEEEVVEVVTLEDVFGLTNLVTISYEGSYVANSYTEAGGSATAAPGKTYYIMKLKLTNVTGQPVDVDNITKRPVIKLVSDIVSVQSEESFLTREFSTYLGAVAAGESVETILLFEVSEAVAEQIVNPTLQITIGNSTKNIKL